MPHFGRTRSARNVSPVFDASMTVDEPLLRIQRTEPAEPLPTLIWKSTSVHLLCRGSRSVRPARVSDSKSFRSMVCVPFSRRSDCATMGALPAPGCFICMMWVKLVVAFSELGMYIEYVMRQVWPCVHF